MKSEVVTVTSAEDGVREALSMTEAFGVKSGLDKKSVLRIRLLAEELLGMLRGIAGQVRADYRLSVEDGRFALSLNANVVMTSEIREQFLSASSSGKNEAANSFMGKIRHMIAGILLSVKETLPYAVMNDASPVYPMGVFAGDGGYSWSMAYYKRNVQDRLKTGSDAGSAWDELEKSIVANLADDVKVKIVGSNVEITVLKAF